MRASLLTVATLLLSASCGCERQSTLIGVDESIAFRIVATQIHDPEIAEAASDTTGRFVVRDEHVLAEWVPIGNSVSFNAKDIANAVTRRTQAHSEVLVLHTENDISETEIAALKGFTDDALHDLTLVTLTDAGSRMFFPLTVAHVGRTVAVIADGEIRAVPRIVTPVRKQIVLSSGKIDKVRVADFAGSK